MKTKSFLALLMMGALLLTSCNQDKGVSDKVNTKPQDVIVSLDLGDNLRAAMADPQALVKAGKASIANVDVYLTTTDGSILTAKRFAATDADFQKLTSVEEIGKKGGYKFVGIDATVTRASVVVNPQGTALTVGENVNELEVSILSKANEAVYAEMNKPVEAMGVEPIDPDPDPAQDKANVKKVQFTLKGDMSRFQVATVFSTIEFKDDAAKEAFLAWRKQYIKDNPGTGRTYDANDADYVAALHAKFGSYNDGNPTAEWLNTWKVVKVTDENKGALMNNFDNILKLSSKEVAERLNFTTFAESYDRADGTLKISGKDVTAVASYFNNNGFTTTFEGTDAKVLAFNFFAKQALGKNLKDKGVAPSLHFYFKGTHVNEDHQFVNLVGYDLGSKTFKESQLLNIDMSKVNNGNGIIVQSDDPTVPDHGKPDVTNNKFNLIVRVTVADWTEVNVTPIAE